jgi:hypothetical protein
MAVIVSANHAPLLPSPLPDEPRDRCGTDWLREARCGGDHYCDQPDLHFGDGVERELLQASGESA